MKNASVNTLENVHQTIPPIDTELLRERCLGDNEFMEMLLRELASTGPRRVAEISLCAEQRDCLETANAAHALKGAAAALGAQPIVRLTSSIEEISRAGSIKGLQELVAELQTEMDRCVKFIPTIVPSV